LPLSVSNHPPVTPSSPFFSQHSAAPPALPPFPTRRSSDLRAAPRRSSPRSGASGRRSSANGSRRPRAPPARRRAGGARGRREPRSEEHTSELQSLTNLVCRLLLEKKNKNVITRV